MIDGLRGIEIRTIKKKKMNNNIKEENGDGAQLAPDVADVAAAISDLYILIQDVQRHHISLMTQMRAAIGNVRAMARAAIRARNEVINVDDEEGGRFSIGDFVRIRNPPPELQGASSFGQVVGFTRSGFVTVRIRGDEARVLRRLPHNLDLII